MTFVESIFLLLLEQSSLRDLGPLFILFSSLSLPPLSNEQLEGEEKV